MNAQEMAKLSNDSREAILQEERERQEKATKLKLLLREKEQREKDEVFAQRIEEINRSIEHSAKNSLDRMVSIPWRHSDDVGRIKQYYVERGFNFNIIRETSYRPQWDKDDCPTLETYSYEQEVYKINW